MQETATEETATEGQREQTEQKIFVQNSSTGSYLQKSTEKTTENNIEKSVDNTNRIFCG